MLPQRIEEWVREGGHWIVGPLTDVRNALGAHYTDREMGFVEKFTGCQLLASIPDSGNIIKSKWADGEAMSAKFWQQLYTPAENGQVLTSVTEGYPAVVGSALAQKITVGKGAVWLLGTIPNERDLQKLMNMVCTEAGVPVPEMSGTLAAIPRAGENRRGLILVELGNAPASYALEEPMTDLLTGNAYENTVELKPYDLLVLEPRK